MLVTKILTHLTENWNLISMSLVKVTVFPHVSLLKRMIFRTARDFYQQNCIEFKLVIHKGSYLLQ